MLGWESLRRSCRKAQAIDVKEDKEGEARRRLLVSDLQRLMRRGAVVILERSAWVVFLYCSMKTAFAWIDPAPEAPVPWGEFFGFGNAYIGIVLGLVWLGYAPYAVYRLARWGYRLVKARF